MNDNSIVRPGNENSEHNPMLIAALGIGCVALMVIALRMMGRVWWCKQGDWAIYIKDAWGSTHTSQHVLDPYVFTHVLHGVMFFLIATLLLPRLAVGWRFLIAVVVECGWELLENSNFIIEKYRANTASFDYFGDSIINSIADVAACSAGFWIAYKLGAWKSLAFFVLVELFLMLWIRDSLMINIVMLLYPIDAIKNWQGGV